MYSCYASIGTTTPLDLAELEADHDLHINRTRNCSNTNKKKNNSIGVLAFEAARLMSKVVHLWRSLEDHQLIRLRDVVLQVQGVRKLVNNDDSFLLTLFLVEMLDLVDSLAREVARLGRRCSNSVLQRFDQAFAEMVKNGSDPHRLEYYREGKMERKVKKMERLIARTTILYQEMEVLAEISLEDRIKLAQARFETKRLQQHKMSLWNRSYDYAVRLLARSLFTIVSRIRQVFCWPFANYDDHDVLDKTPIAPMALGVDDINMASPGISRSRSYSIIHPCLDEPYSSTEETIPSSCGGSLTLRTVINGAGRRVPLIRSLSNRRLMEGGYSSAMITSDRSSRGEEALRFHISSGTTNMLFVQAVVESQQRSSSYDQLDIASTSYHSSYAWLIEWSRKLLRDPPPTTLGGAALAFHYANIIIFIGKLAASPEWIRSDDRDVLYYSLPTGIRKALISKLRNTSHKICHDDKYWRDTLGSTMELLAPLARDTITWHSDRNLEQRQLMRSSMVTRPLLLQTLYFADQTKTEAAIVRLLVSLTHIRSIEMTKAADRPRVHINE